LKFNFDIKKNMKYLWKSDNLENLLNSIKINCYFLNQGMIVADCDDNEQFYKFIDFDNNCKI
jgi:hypothetical protein